MELNGLLRGCSKCSDEFYDNVALIADDNGNLTKDQEAAVLQHLMNKHAIHQGVRPYPNAKPRSSVA